jgi:hypothetical protein
MKGRGTLENAGVSVKLRLAIMWAVVMFFYLYNDVFMLLQGVRSGEGVSENPPDEITLLVYAMIITPSALMPLACIALPATISRWLNIVVGLLYFGVIVWTILPADTSLFYRFIGIVENIVTLGIIWTAWRWPRVKVATA